MESCSKILLLAAALLNISVIHGDNVCPISSSSCGTVHYPFKFDGQTPPNNCTYFNLTCNTTTPTGAALLLNLPYAGGDFYVKAIDYVHGYIQLYDPGNYLIARLMMTNFTCLNSGPFKAIAYQNYAIYVCPRDSQALRSDRVYVLACLSNSTSSITVATRELSSDLMGRYGCAGVGSWPVPGPAQGDDDGLDHGFSMFLTWDVVECKDCEENIDDGQESSKWPGVVKPLACSTPALFLLALTCCSAFFLHLVRILEDKQEGDDAAGTPQDTTTVPQPAAATNNTCGLDESKIMECTQVVVLGEESAENIPCGNKNNANVCCSICLDSYRQKDAVRVISKCGHYFHADCLQQWLAKNGTCPVCRTRLADTD